MNQESDVVGRRIFYVGVFASSAILMVLQILQSRILSVTTWYHLAFLVVSQAMFGLTLAGLAVVRMDEQNLRKSAMSAMANASRRFGFCILLALSVQLGMPLVFESPWIFITFPVVCVVSVLPYYQIGIVLSIALTRTSFPVGLTYGVDLAGAAVGCIVALLLMQVVDAPSAILLLALFAVGVSHLFQYSTRAAGVRSWGKLLDPLALALIALIVVNVGMERPLIYPHWVKGKRVKQSALSHDGWNSISRVTVTNEFKNFTPFLWGASPKLPDDLKSSFYYLEIDGDASTPISRFDGKDRLSVAYLEHDVTTVAYSLPQLNRAAIIGVGGGRDVLAAHYFGVTDIIGLDLNNAPIALLTQIEPFSSYAGLANLPSVQLIHSEARSWFANNRESFDIIQMSLIDTWAATTAGAFALSENGLYTVEAFKTFLSDLRGQGVLTVSRWYHPEAKNEMQRLLVMTSQALFELGMKEPAAHIFVARSGRIATLVLARQPLTPTQISALKERCERQQFEILAQPEAPGIFDDVLQAPNATALLALAENNTFDITPTRDTRPFFFNQMRLLRPWEVFRLVRSHTTGAAFGHAKASLNLYLILCFTVVMVGGVIVLPLRHTLRDIKRSYAISGTTWFSMIGLGFMLLEIGLLQRISIYLGHPSFSLGIVLFSLILSTGIGSLLSVRYPLRNFVQQVAWALGVASLSFVLPFVIESAFESFSDSGFFIRAALSVLIVSPLGGLLGYGFPTGMSFVRAIDERPAPWFWGINGAAGVLGGAVAVALNIALGVGATIIIGGVCYAALIIPAAVLGRLASRCGDGIS